MGGCASNENSGVDYSHIAAGFKGLVSHSGKSRISCCDEDGLFIDQAVANLKRYSVFLVDVLVLHFVYGVSKRKIAKNYKVDEKTISEMIVRASFFVGGYVYYCDPSQKKDEMIYKTLQT